jgi:uncharacterized protein (DUF4415 family)
MRTTSKKNKREENPEWKREDFDKAVRMGGLPASLQRVLSAQKRGPQKAPVKVPVSIRLSPDVLDNLKASGAGWQTRVDKILRAALIPQRVKAAK